MSEIIMGYIPSEMQISAFPGKLENSSAAFAQTLGDKDIVKLGVWIDNFVMLGVGEAKSKNLGQNWVASKVLGKMVYGPVIFVKVTPNGNYITVMPNEIQACIMSLELVRMQLLNSFTDIVTG